MMSNKPKFIWIDEDYKEDSYVEFVSTFLSKNEKALIDIGVDSDYELYINGKFVNCGAYLSYPGTLYLDTLNLNLKKGKNTLKIIVYYNGADTFATYYKKDPVLFFKVYDNENVYAVSNSNVLCRYDVNYQSFNKKRITYQLGYKVFYDFAGKNYEFRNSIELNKDLKLLPRPNEKVCLKDKIIGNVVKDENDSIIFDLGKETVGYLCILISSIEEKDITVSFGEHIKEGKILDLLGDRDFRFNIHLKKGLNEKTFYLRRIGCRYLSINNKDDLEIKEIGLIPASYPFKAKQIKKVNDFDKKLIDIARYTIECCYHDHFEDCPWREQAEYTFDERCTLLGFYKLFDNPEVLKSSIELMLDDPRDDGDLDVTFPSHFYLIIPSFTLHFILLISEYYFETKDKDLCLRAVDKINLIISSYLQKMDDGLLCINADHSHWLFYEWKQGFDGNSDIKPSKDFLLNTIFLYSLQLTKRLFNEINVDFKFNKFIDPLKSKIVKEFFDEKSNKFIFAKESKITSELMLAYAILTDLIPEKNAEFAKLITSKKVNESTNSFKSIVYEALLKVSQLNKDYILGEIRENYGRMIKDGATTFYETNLGYKDFDNAGSLCHGWNAFIVKFLLELE